MNKVLIIILILALGTNSYGQSKEEKEIIKEGTKLYKTTAKLFVHDATQPTLIVSDLKHGEEGSIGLWIGPDTEAHFRNLAIIKND